MKRLLVSAATAVMVAGALGCGSGDLDKTEISLPKCITATGKCDSPRAFQWRNPGELWAWSSNAVGVRRGGNWEWSFPCVEGELLSTIAFRGDEVWMFCDQELRRQVPPAKPTKVESPRSVSSAFIQLDGDFLVVGSDGLYGWNGTTLEKAVPPAPQPGWEGALDAIGLRRDALYFNNQYWDGSAWTPVDVTPNSRFKYGSGTSRRVDGKICLKGRYAMNGAVGQDIVDAVRSSIDGSFVDSHDCSTVLAAPTGAPGTLFEAGRGEDLEELGVVPGFTNYGLGVVFRIDADTLLVSSPQNVPGSPAELFEYELH